MNTFKINNQVFRGLSRTHRVIIRTQYRRHLAFRARTGYDLAKEETKATWADSLRARGFKYDKVTTEA